MGYKYFWYILLAFLCISCSDIEEQLNYVNFDIVNHIEKHREFIRYKPYSYRFIYSYKGQTTERYRIVVTQGHIDSVIHLQTNQSFPVTHFKYYSINHFFTDITNNFALNNAINKDNTDTYITDIKVTYDSTYAFLYQWKYTFNKDTDSSINSDTEFFIDSFTVIE